MVADGLPCKDDRTMHELYAWPFAESIRAGVGSVMMAYNAVSDFESSGDELKELTH